MATFDTADPKVAPYINQSAGNPRKAAGVDVSARLQPSGAYGGGFGARMANAWRYLVSGVSDPLAFFSPQQPLLPQAQEPAAGVVGRAFDYPSGYNQLTPPRANEAISFATLKAMADGYDFLRLLIETRKDQIATMKWTIGPRDPSKARDARCDALEEFWNFPDREHSWFEWSRMAMEQMLVLDALSLYCEPDRAGRLHALRIIDGATIARKITIDGRTPRYDEGPAYQEVIKGLPAVDYIRPPPFGEVVMDPATGVPMPELIYRPRNTRVDRVYGYSPVEQIVTTVNIALRRQFSQLSYYTDGSTPDLIFSVPENWNPAQIAQFQEWWNSILAGNLENRRGTMFVPGGVKPTDTKDRVLMDKYDEWLARICCFAFSVSPTAFVTQVNRATAEDETKRALEEGFLPILTWIVDLVDYVNRVKFGVTDLTLRWAESDEIEPKTQAEIDVALVGAKIYHPDEIRQRRGDVPMDAALREQMNVATFNAASNATQLPPDQQAAADARAEVAAERAQAQADARANAAGATGAPNSNGATGATGTNGKPPADGGAGTVGKARGAGSNQSTPRAVRY